MDRTLDELEANAWGDPPRRASYLQGTLRALRRKPIGDFTIEDLRICVGQQVGLAWLIPIAISRLEDNPLAAGDLYPGDLLVAVVRARASMSGRDDLLPRVTAVVKRARKQLTGVRARRAHLEHVVRELSDHWPD